MQLSPHFRLEEFLVSQTAARHGIDMEPGLGVVHHLVRLCIDVLEPLRNRMGVPVFISSGYRPLALNTRIGGATNSAHITGRAADVGAAGIAPLAVMRIAAELPNVDKCILEFGRWVHLQIAQNGTAPRRRVLTAYREAGRTVYAPGIVEGV